MLAAIDVGTNSVRLLIGEVVHGTVVPVAYRRVVTRLGAGYSLGKNLSVSAQERTLTVLNDFAAEISKAKVSAVKAVATEALRRSAEGPAFLDQVKQQSGLTLEIIDGEREALLTCRGVLSALKPRPESCLVFDVGGGSTEFVFCMNGRPLWQASYPLGVVALAEAGRSAATGIDEVLGSVRADLLQSGHLATVLEPACSLVGTAGTVTTLGAIHLEMVKYDWQRINNLVLTREDVQQLSHELCRRTAAELSGLPGLEPGREDLIGPGSLIVKNIFEVFAKTSLRISDFGLLEGALLELSTNQLD